jgi:hypothetical protein
MNENDMHEKSNLQMITRAEKRRMVRIRAEFNTLLPKGKRGPNRKMRRHMKVEENKKKEKENEK